MEPKVPFSSNSFTYIFLNQNLILYYAQNKKTKKEKLI